MSSILVINAAGRETRVALVENGHIAEFYLERKKDKGVVGNIYKGRVVRVLPGMQAAFVDIGLEKAAFLYVSDVVYDPDFARAEFELTEGEHEEAPEVPELGEAETEHTPNPGQVAGADAPPGDSSQPEPGTDPNMQEVSEPSGQASPATSQPGSQQDVELHVQEHAPGELSPPSGKSITGEYEAMALSREGGAPVESPGVAPPAPETSQPMDASGLVIPEQVGELRAPREAPERGARDRGPDRDRDRGGRGDRGRRDGRDGRDRNRGGGRDRDRERDDEKPKMQRKNQRIEDLLKPGQEVVVQISKDPIGTKGARLTSHISIPGRHLVFMPTVDHVGISRRIGNEKERRRLRETVDRMRPPGTGFIVRTVAENVPQEKLESDIRFLIEVWNEVVRRNEKRGGPGLMHPDLDLILRATRDLFAHDVEKLVIDDREEYDRVVQFVVAQDPSLKERVLLHDNEEPIFDAYGIEHELNRAVQRKVWLKSGGYLIMDQAEALTAIDVNSGRYVGKKSLEETITKINVEAAKEIVYQLRLRNIGGIIICDFIDMEKSQNRDKVFKALQEALGRDKAKTNVLRISELGLVEMTRKRVRESIGRMLHEDCTYCDGQGFVKTATTVNYEIFRELRREAASYREPTLVIACHPDVAALLNGDERPEMRHLMDRFNKTIQVKPQTSYHREQYDIYGRSAQGVDQKLHSVAAPGSFNAEHSPAPTGNAQGQNAPAHGGQGRGDRNRDRGGRGGGGGGGGDRGGRDERGHRGGGGGRPDRDRDRDRDRKGGSGERGNRSGEPQKPGGNPSAPAAEAAPSGGPPAQPPEPGPGQG